MAPYYDRFRYTAPGAVQYGLLLAVGLIDSRRLLNAERLLLRRSWASEENVILGTNIVRDVVRIVC